jgi:hypothetical protein
MKDKTGEGIYSKARENQGSTEPLNWSIINLSIFILTYQMQGRFKMEYRLFTIVRYNYKDYNTPSKPNMHARLKTMQRETSTKTKRISGRQQDSKKFFKNLKAGDRREERKLRKSEVKQEQRQE